MSKKDINIHIGLKDTDKLVQDSGRAGDALNETGRKAEQAGKKTAASSKEASGKLLGMGSVLDSITSKAISFLGVWRAADWFISMLEKWEERLKRIRDLQREIHDESLSLQDLGQSLEIQTGTVGEQGSWAEYITEVKKAGGFQSDETATTAAISFDIATQSSGGLQNQANKDLLLNLAPMFGAAQLGGDEIKKFLDYSTTAQVEQSEQGYQDFFNQVMTGYRSSKSSDFGTFVTGLQSGTTGMLSRGASVESAISTYVQAMSVMKNEEVAATLTEQIGRMSSGAYEKPRQALEGFTGRSWETMSSDDQLKALLDYTQSIPENQRVQKLTEYGFSPELSTGLAKMTSSEAIRAMESTRQSLQNADPTLLEQQIKAYEESLPKKSRETDADREKKGLDLDKKVGGFQERLKAAQSEVEMLAAEGKDDFWTDDEYESYITAYNSMIEDLDEMEAQAKESGGKGSEQLIRRIQKLRSKIDMSNYQLKGTAPFGHGISTIQEEWETRKGPQYQQEFESIEDRAQTVIINYNNDYSRNIRTKDPGSPPRTGDL